MMNSSVYAVKRYGQFAEADKLDLPAEALAHVADSAVGGSAQAGATIRKNLEALGYGE